jgi:Type IV secretory system Conjugative DNA transfer
MTAVALLGAALVAVILLAGWLGEQGKGSAPAAKWASWWELRTLRLRRPRSGRLVLGRQGGTLIAAEPLASAIVLAPTQSQKTTGLAIPALLEWCGPVVATSIKTDLVHATIERRRAPAMRWSMTRVGRRSSRASRRLRAGRLPGLARGAARGQLAVWGGAAGLGWPSGRGVLVRRCREALGAAALGGGG